MEKIVFLPDVLVLLITAVFVVALFRKLNLSPVLGYFCAGSIIGPYGFGFILNTEETATFGEIGIIFLLFAIGLELTFDRIKAMRVHVFGFGSAQILITSCALCVFLRFIGFDYGATIVIGGGLAMSSTAIVLQVLGEKRMQSTQPGRLSIATLLMQDFAVVPLLVLLPIISGENNVGILPLLLIAFVKAVIALSSIFILSRLFLRPIFSMIGANQVGETNELFVATTLLIALGAAWLTEHFGLSTALGAFVAGSMVAETEFQQQAEESISHFKALFLGLFFMTVGMNLDLNLMIEKLGVILLSCVSLITLKTIIIILLASLFKFSMGSSIQAGLLLSQGGEFAFVLLTLAQKQNIISIETQQILLLIITITMAVTPMLASIGERIAERLERGRPKSVLTKELSDINNHVIIAGFGRVGKMVARMLETEGIQYVVCDARQKIVDEAIDEGFPAYLGDIGSSEQLNLLRAERAQSIIISFPGRSSIMRSVRRIREHNTNIPIISRIEDLTNAFKLHAIGVDILVPETYETGLQLGGAVLQSIGISEFEISRLKNRFRAGNYVNAYTEEDDE